jgi:hypothetical protein
MLVPVDCQQRVLSTLYDNFFSDGVLVSLLVELFWLCVVIVIHYINTPPKNHIQSRQYALLAINRYQHFMDFRGFLLKVTTRSTRD